MKWALWAVLLLVQAGSGTWASRARNGGSYSYHTLAATVSHAAYFMTTALLVESLTSIARRGSWQDAAWLCGFFTFFCTLGSVLAHYVAATFFETGNRRVGVYREKQ